MTGSSGNSLVTGALLVIATAAVGLLCFRRDIVLLPADYLFFALMLCILSSSVFNGWTSNAKEYALIVVSLAAYPACRFISRADIAAGRASFIRATGTIVVLGSIVTAAALWQQWNDPHGKPLVFGFDAAGTYFLGSLCFLIIALATSGRLNLRRTAVVSSLIFLPAAIFAASLVRFTFIALAGTLCLAVLLSEARQRKYVVIMACVILVAVAAGLLARYDQARQFAGYAIEQSPGEIGLERPPSCYLTVNFRNSIAIRKALVQDALFLIPRSGWIGTGLDSFMEFSCIKLTQVHNSVLQAAVEFGWLGGSLLLALMVVAAASLFPPARYDDASRFVLCGLAFVVLLSLAHGRVSRDGVLFALLGCAVGLTATSRAPAPVRPTVVA
ncbi:MAG: O-antigen ligase family protein [Bradyrhizobium sp.]|nr:O-antigen ligase family protein [Bradyrhizobium sp.]